MHPAGFDLNLLRTLDILEQERSVQRAAGRLNLTPSAVSHALARLRRGLDDPLFARSGPSMVPTPRCRAVLSEVRPFLAAVELALQGGSQAGAAPFDPALDRRSVTIAMPGAVELSLLPALAERVTARAPGWTLQVTGFQRRSYEADLVSGEVDAVLSVGGHTPSGEGLSIGTLWEDELVALQGPAGPLPRDRAVSLDHVVGLPQVYPLPWPRSQNYLDIRLAREGRQRAIRLALPGYATLGDALSRTTLVATMPDRTALAILRRHGDLDLVRIAPPIRTKLALETSERFAASPAGQWFLAELTAAAATIPGVEPPSGPVPS